MSRLNELRDEFRKIFAGKGFWFLDALLPLTVYLLITQWIGPGWAVLAAVAGAGLIAVIRLVQKASPLGALAGVGGAALAGGFVYLSGRESGYFLPGLISGGLTVLVCLGSVVLRRPAAAWTSHLTRRWPLDWYWLDRVRPAYAEVSLMWAAAFGSRTALEFWLVQRASLSTLGFLKIVLGWPFTILILIVSYLFGIWRLRTLGGPSVEEFLAGSGPPWQGQQRGF